jgi:diguanylate cyclase (GGDEF)-like protein/PAS domain S-box-containing protein
MSQNPPLKDPSVNGRDELLRRIRELETRCGQAEEALRTSEEQHNFLADSSPLGILVVDTQGRILRANEKMLDILAWPANQNITQLNIFKHAPLVDSGVVDALRRCLEKRARVTSDHLCPQGRNGHCHLRYHVSPLIQNDEECSGIIAFVEDVTELKLAEEAIMARERKYRLLFESAPVAMIQHDVSELKHHLEQLRMDGISDLRSYFDEHPQELFHCMELIKTIDCNPAFLDLMEVQTWDEIDSFFRSTDSPDYLMRIAREIVLSVAESTISNEREDELVTIRGTKKRVLARSLPLTEHEGTLSRIVVAIIDITKRKEAEEALRASEQRFREQAMRDNLTGLYNRRYLYQSLTELVEYSKIKGLLVSVIFMDLDHFKDVVDTYGHLNGSLTIKEVGQTIQEITKSPAYAVAYAGDEFVAVLPDYSAEQALDIAKEIRDRIRNRVFLQDQGFEVRIRSSFGIATFPYHAKSMTDLLAAADKALFAAKSAGKDIVMSAA